MATRGREGRWFPKENQSDRFWIMKCQQYSKTKKNTFGIWNMFSLACQTGTLRNNTFLCCNSRHEYVAYHKCIYNCRAQYGRYWYIGISHTQTQLILIFVDQRSLDGTKMSPSFWFLNADPMQIWTNQAQRTNVWSQFLWDQICPNMKFMKSQ